MFVRACSGWSLGCGLIRPDVLFRWAQRFKVPSVCLADFDNLYGAIEFYDRARQEGVRSILGAVVATVGVRRYGFEFSCAIAGLDGEIVLGECDRGGHLWIYYPRCAFRNGSQARY